MRHVHLQLDIYIVFLHRFIMASNGSSILKMHMEYGGIKSRSNQPSGQVNHVSQDQGRQASNSNLLALPGICHLLLIQVFE